MKKLLLPLATLAAFCVNAETVTFDFTQDDYGLPNDGDTYVTTPATITSGDVSIVLGQNAEGNAWRMWTDGLREYYKGVATFEVSAGGEPIKAVSWTVVSGATFALDGTTDNITSWEGSQESVKFVSTATSNKAVKTITVTYGADAEVPDTPKGPEGQLNVAEAITWANTGWEGEVTVKGIVSQVDSYNSTWNSITYYISDNGETTAQLQIYSGKGLNGANFTSKDDVEVGATVVVKGDLKLYNGAPEINMNSVILEYTAPEGGSQGGEEPEDPDTPDTPETPEAPESASVTFDFTHPENLNPAQDTENVENNEINLVNVTLTEGVISVLSENNGTGTNPRLYNSVNGWDYRFYANNLITISAEEGYTITYIAFTANNLNNSTIVFSDNGTYYADGNVWASNDENGVSSLTITKTATGSNPSISTMTVYYLGDDNSGIANVDVENANAPVEYFNLQGIRVQNPENGIYIRREGSKVTKVIL